MVQLFPVYVYFCVYVVEKGVPGSVRSIMVCVGSNWFAYLASTLVSYFLPQWVSNCVKYSALVFYVGMFFCDNAIHVFFIFWIIVGVVCVLHCTKTVLFNKWGTFQPDFLVLCVCAVAILYFVHSSIPFLDWISIAFHVNSVKNAYSLIMSAVGFMKTFIK
jgi:hypothetical protein